MERGRDLAWECLSRPVNTGPDGVKWEWMGLVASHQDWDTLTKPCQQWLCSSRPESECAWEWGSPISLQTLGGKKRSFVVCSGHLRRSTWMNGCKSSASQATQVFHEILALERLTEKPCLFRGVCSRHSALKMNKVS